MFANDDSQSENYVEESDIFDADLDSDITIQELKKAVFHKKNNKYYGLDNICTDVLKSSFAIIIPFLLKLINQILTQENIQNHGAVASLSLSSKVAMLTYHIITGESQLAIYCPKFIPKFY